MIGGAVRKKQTRCERFLTLSVHILNLQFEEQCVLVCYMMTKTGDGISMLKKIKYLRYVPDHISRQVVKSLFLYHLDYCSMD